MTGSDAWAGGDTYQAWLLRFGAPEVAAAWLRADPVQRLGPSLLALMLPGYSAPPYSWPGTDSETSQEAAVAAVPQLFAGQRVANLMGSHGCKAVALALMGAQVSVVDVAPGNKHYAEEVAAAAGVTLRYKVCDVLQLPDSAPDLLGLQDMVLLENGILHYFTDLQALYKVVRALLVPGRGRLVLRDFHPVSTKLITNKSGKLKVTGDYFDTTLVPMNAAFTKYSSSNSSGDSGNHKSSSESAGRSGIEMSTRQVMLRQWTLGEVVSEACSAGLILEQLLEEQGPRSDDKGLPKSFGFVARHAG
ncbi:methylase [Haematococcus lacustris]